MIDLTQLLKPCSCGKEHKVSLHKIVISDRAIDTLLFDLKSGLWEKYHAPVIICDTNTYRAVCEIKGEAFLAKLARIELPADHLVADNAAIDTVNKQWKMDYDLILAVGSGSIHDISRYTAKQKGVAFISVPTAASVDGFVSTVAAMTWDGMKTTLPAVPPVAVYADSSVFSRAPYRLTASGISDLMGKYTALADWRISHLVTGEYICERICRMEEEAMQEVRACIPKLTSGDQMAYESLMSALILSGVAMQMVGNSRPASGSEHHISHLWEMDVLGFSTEALHGEKVSVGLMLVLEKYKQVLNAIRTNSLKICSYPSMTEEERKMFAAKGILDAVERENTPEPLKEINKEVLKTKLPEIAAILEALPDISKLQELFLQAGCVYSMEQIHIPESYRNITLQMAPYVRRRMTFLRMCKLFEENIF